MATNLNDHIYCISKSAIRHQNSEMDNARRTEIDASFYTLPPAIQQHIKQLMKTFEEGDYAIFATDYKQKMARKATHIE